MVMFSNMEKLQVNLNKHNNKQPDILKVRLFDFPDARLFYTCVQNR